MSLKIDMADIEFMEGMGSINLSNHDQPDRSPFISITTSVRLEGDIEEVKKRLYQNALDMLSHAQDVLKKELESK